MKVFGCIAYACRMKYRMKFEPKVIKCIFIGYANESKAYKLYDSMMKRVIISLDVQFNELGGGILTVKVMKSQKGLRITEISDEDSNKTAYIDMNANNMIDKCNNRAAEDSEDNENTPKHRANKTLKCDLGAYWQLASRK